MNIVFTCILTVGIGILLFTAPDAVFSSLLEGGTKGLDFALRLFPVYAIWLSVLLLWNKMGLDKFLSKAIKPLLKKIFPNESDECYGDLSVNLSANLLGMGSAGTPAGMKAAEEMAQRKNRVMLLVVNSTSIQLIPTTIVAMRSAQGATQDIILPTFLCTLCTTFIGMIAVAVFVK